jgi:hypothetical protein
MSIRKDGKGVWVGVGGGGGGPLPGGPPTSLESAAQRDVGVQPSHVVTTSSRNGYPDQVRFIARGLQRITVARPWPSSGSMPRRRAGAI